MERLFDSQIDDLKKLITGMGGHVEKALGMAMRGLTQKDQLAFKEVYEMEEHINSDHVRVDKECVSFLARQGPFAKDLRLIVSLIKINADLERMGDQCVNIAHTSKDYLNHPVVPIPKEISEMAEITRQMVRNSLDCFVREDSQLAKEILLMDDEVDTRKRQVFDDLITLMQKDSARIVPALDLILIARNLERMGDHATNIAEDVIFVSTGKDVRHGGKYS